MNLLKKPLPALSKLRLLFLLFSHLCFSVAAFAENISDKEWQQTIPATGQLIHADIMALQGSKEFAALAAKMQTGLRKNPEWATQFIRSAPKGKPLPYHPNLGLTEQEYKKMLALTQAMHLTKVGTLGITFEPLTEGRIKIITNQDSMLNNLILSAKAVETPFGKLTDITRKKEKPTPEATGPWTGIIWTKNTVNEQKLTGENIQFAIGKRIGKENQGIIYYDGKILKGTNLPPTQFTQVLFFPLGK